MTYEAKKQGKKEKVSRKGHESENLSVLEVELKTEILATMC